MSANGKKIREKMRRYAMLQSSPACNSPKLSERTRLTRWVSGKMTARACAHAGRFSTGKKVPLNRNMGVTNKNIGRLNMSMVGVMPVKYIPSAPKAIPPRNATGIMSKPEG